MSGDHYEVIESAGRAQKKVGDSTTEWGAVDLMQKAVRADPFSSYAIYFVADGEAVGAPFCVYSGNVADSQRQEIESERRSEDG